MNGVVIAWDEAAPAGSESIGNGDNRIRSMKTDLRNALDDEHVFPSSGGTAGQHRVGSGRAFYGTQSRVSASTTSAPAGDGRLMMTSDTTRLFGVGSEGTAFIGGFNVASLGSVVDITMPQRKIVVFESGLSKAGASESNFTITFPNSGFSQIIGAWFTVRRGGSEEATSGSHAHFNLTSLTSTGFDGAVVEDSNGGGVAAKSATSLYWFALGTRAI